MSYHFELQNYDKAPLNEKLYLKINETKEFNWLLASSKKKITNQSPKTLLANDHDPL